MSTAEKGPPIKRLAGGVDDPADPAVVRRNVGVTKKLYPVADRHAVARGIGQNEAKARRQPQYLAPGGQIAAVYAHPVTNRRRCQPCNLRQPSAGLHDAPNAADGGTSGNFCQQSGEEVSHGILPLFALNRF
jgi:hypothetical protein